MILVPVIIFFVVVALWLSSLERRFKGNEHSIMLANEKINETIQIYEIRKLVDEKKRAQ